MVVRVVLGVLHGDEDDQHGAEVRVLLLLVMLDRLDLFGRVERVLRVATAAVRR